MAHGEVGKGKTDRSQVAGKATAQMRTKSELLGHIAWNFYSVEEIGKIVESQERKQRPDLPNEYVAPRNDLERSISEIWQKVLGIEKVGIYDKFLELGGNSLLGTRIVSRLTQKTGVGIALQHLFDSPTVASLANFIGTLQFAKRGRSAAEESNKDGREVIAF